jgi:hypothetical protein
MKEKRTMKFRLAALSLAALWLAALSTVAPVPAAARAQAGGDWPQWRGTDRDGLSKETGLLKQWPEGGPPLAWKATGAGRGYSSMSLAGGRLYTMGLRGEREFGDARGPRRPRLHLVRL